MEMITSAQVTIRKKREQSASDWKDGTTVHNYNSWVFSLKYLAHDNDDGEMIEENKNRKRIKQESKIHHTHQLLRKIFVF